MSVALPAKEILSNHSNEAGIVHDPLRPDRLYAEELDAVYGRLVSGVLSANPFSLLTAGSERVTEFGDAKLRSLYAAGAVGGEIPAGAGSRLLYYPAAQAIRGGTVTGTDWDAASLGVGSVGFGTDVKLTGIDGRGFGKWLDDGGFTAALLLGAGVSAVSRLTATSDAELLVAFNSDVPTLRVTKATGAGTVGMVALALGATSPTAMCDIGASTAAAASLRIRAGIDVAAPNEGDIWLTAAGSLKGRVNGATVTLAGVGFAGSAFSALTGGTNSTAAMIVGTGASLTVSGTGTINATTLGGATFAAPGAIGGTTPGAITGTNILANGTLTAGTNAMFFDTGAYYMRLWNGCQLVWDSTGAATALSQDSGIARVSAGILRASNGGTGLGMWRAGTSVVAKTADFAPTAIESRTKFTNEGAGGAIIGTLPSAATGYSYSVYRQADQTITITAAAGDTIRVGGSVTAAAGSITLDSVGTYIRITAINATEWIVGVLAGSVTV